jgi:predicted O-methyltransferase YrrM
MVRYFAPQTVLELGTNLGFSAAYIAAALPPGGTLTTVEGAEPVARIAQNVLDTLGLAKKVRIVVQKFEDFLPAAADFAFIDGRHTAAAMWEHYRTIDAPIMVFDDLYWSADTARGWKRLIAQPDAVVTMDLFRFGVVVRRREQAKEHFVLRWRG